jgi:hypothetical protein
MVASKQDIVSAYQQSTHRLEGLVAGCSQEDLKKTAYEGWTARQLICHMAHFRCRLLHQHGPASGQGMGGGFDIDRWNAEQVAADGQAPEDVWPSSAPATRPASRPSRRRRRPAGEAGA